MHHAASRILPLLVTSLAVGCGVGNEGGGGGGLVGGDDYEDVLGITCAASYGLTGTFAPAAPTRPSDTPTGCWPVGTWTFSVALEDSDCAAAPVQLATSYAFRVDRTDDPALGWVESYAYLGDMAALYRLKVTEGGGGDCEGGLELYSADGTEHWNFKPALFDTGNALSGFAEYTRFEDSQR